MLQSAPHAAAERTTRALRRSDTLGEVIASSVDLQATEVVAHVTCSERPVGRTLPVGTLQASARRPSLDRLAVSRPRRLRSLDAHQARRSGAHRRIVTNWPSP